MTLANDTIIALMMFGDLPKTLPHFLINEDLDSRGIRDLRLIAHHQLHGFAITEEDLLKEDVINHASTVRDNLRRYVQRQLNQAARDEIKKQAAIAKNHARQESLKINAAFAAMHAPSPQGTVKELAQKYNVSLSEIRRRKREGTLNELN